MRHLVFEHGRVLPIRNTHQQTVLVRNDIEERKITGTGQQHIRIIIDILAHAEITAVRITQRFEDRGLVVITRSEELDHLFGLFLLLVYRTILRNDLQHPLLDGRNHLFGQYGRLFLLFGLGILIHMPLERTVITFADRVLYT